MTVTTFSMDSTSSAPTAAGAALVPYDRRWSAEWVDVTPREALLRVEHPEEDTKLLVGRLLAADPGVKLVG
jgi:hypothetical protein